MPNYLDTTKRQNKFLPKLSSFNNKRNYSNNTMTDVNEDNCKIFKPFSSLTTNNFFYKDPKDQQSNKVFKTIMQEKDYKYQNRIFSNNSELEIKDKLRHNFNIITNEQGYKNPWKFERFNYLVKNKKANSSNKTYIRDPNYTIVYDPITHRYMNKYK